MKKFTGDSENTPLSEILKYLGYSYRDSRSGWRPNGQKEIYPSHLDHGDLIFPEDVLFVGDFSQVWAWLIETNQVEQVEQVNQVEQDI